MYLDDKKIIEILREKADVYEQHPDYPWQLPGDGAGHVIAHELRSTAGLIEWVASRVKVINSPVTDQALSDMYHAVRREDQEGSLSESIRHHSQACGIVAYKFNVHPDRVALAVKEVKM